MILLIIGMTYWNFSAYVPNSVQSFWQGQSAPKNENTTKFVSSKVGFGDSKVIRVIIVEYKSPKKLLICPLPRPAQGHSNRPGHRGFEIRHPGIMDFIYT